MLKRTFDLVTAGAFVFVCWPVYLLIAIGIILDSKGGVFYRQIRVGKQGVHFGLYKFRTMRVGSDKTGQLTIGEKDQRITRMGYWLRKTKLDELPQLLNIIIGDMSVVGPRPEVPKYVAYYNEEQQQVLSVRPGLTDYASLAYIKENEILAESANPEATYINEIMPKKLELNLTYIKEQNFWVDLKIIGKTLLKIVTTY